MQSTHICISSFCYTYSVKKKKNWKWKWFYKHIFHSYYKATFNILICRFSLLLWVSWHNWQLSRSDAINTFTVFLLYKYVRINCHVKDNHSIKLILQRNKVSNLDNTHSLKKKNALSIYYLSGAVLIPRWSKQDLRPQI